MVTWPTLRDWFRLTPLQRLGWLIYTMVVLSDYSERWVALYMWWQSLGG